VGRKVGEQQEKGDNRGELGNEKLFGRVGERKKINSSTISVVLMWGSMGRATENQTRGSDVVVSELRTYMARTPTHPLMVLLDDWFCPVN
jgi:hypothetical protein